MKKHFYIAFILCLLVNMESRADFTFEFLDSIAPRNKWYDLTLDTTNHIAYYCDFSGIYSCDYSDPENPEFMDYIALPHEPSRDIIYYKSYLFVQGDECIELFSTENPSELQHVSTFDQRANRGFYNVDSLLFLIDDEEGLVLWDISEPEDSFQLYEDSSITVKIAMEGRLACLTQAHELALVDFSDPINPEHLNTISFEDQPFGLDITNGILTIKRDNFWISIWDVSDPLNPNPILDEWLQLEGFTSVIWFDEIAWFSTSLDPLNGMLLRELHVYDFSDPDTPELVGIFEEDNGYGRLKKDGLLVLGAQRSYGMSITTASNSSNPVRISQIKDPHSTPMQIEVVDGKIGINQYYSAWRYIDATDLGDIREITRIENGICDSFVKTEHYLFLEHDAQFEIYDMTVPESPELLDFYPVEFGIGEIAVVEGVVACVAAWNRLIFLDVSTPESIQFLGEWLLPNYFEDRVGSIDLVDNYVVLGTGNGMQLLDISDPTSPERVTTDFTDLEVFSRTARKENLLFVLLSTNHEDRRLHVIDLNELPDFVLAAPLLQLPTDSQHPAVQENWLFVPSITNGTTMYDISDLSNINEIGHLDPIWSARCCDVEGDLLYVGEYAGINVYRIIEDTAVEPKEELTLPSNPVLLSSYPNPFNSSTTIRFSLPVQDLITIQVFDLLGREVLAFPPEQCTKGRFSRSINAEGFANGVYLLRISGKSGWTDTQKIVLVK